MSFFDSFKSKTKLHDNLKSNEADAMETFFHIGLEREKAYYKARSTYKAWLEDLKNYTMKKVEAFNTEESRNLGDASKEGHTQNEEVAHHTEPSTQYRRLLQPSIFDQTREILLNNGNKPLTPGDIAGMLIMAGRKINAKKPHDSVRATLFKYIKTGKLKFEDGKFSLKQIVK
jgi:hypothetical protein